MKKIIFIITIIIIFFAAPFAYAEEKSDGTTLTLPEIHTFDAIPADKIFDGLVRVTKGLHVAGEKTIQFIADLLNGKVKPEKIEVAEIQKVNFSEQKEEKVTETKGSGIRSLIGGLFTGALFGPKSSVPNDKVYTDNIAKLYKQADTLDVEVLAFYLKYPDGKTKWVDGGSHEEGSFAFTVPDLADIADGASEVIIIHTHPKKFINKIYGGLDAQSPPSSLDFLMSAGIPASFPDMKISFQVVEPKGLWVFSTSNNSGYKKVLAMVAKTDGDIEKVTEATTKYLKKAADAEDAIVTSPALTDAGRQEWVDAYLKEAKRAGARFTFTPRSK